MYVHIDKGKNMKAFASLLYVDWKCSLGWLVYYDIKRRLESLIGTSQCCLESKQIRLKVNFSICTCTMQCTKMHKICVRKGRRESLRYWQLRLLFQSSKVHSLKIFQMHALHAWKAAGTDDIYLRATPLETSQLSIFMALRSASSLPSKTSPKPPFITSPL